MIVYFANRGMTIIELASSNTEKGLIIDNDDKILDVDTGSVTFEFDIYFNEDNREKAVESTRAGNYILKKTKDEYEFYTIIDTEVDTKAMSIHIYAEDVGLDLLNEVTDSSYTNNTTAYTIAHYVNKLIYDTGFEIGLDEIGNTRTRTLQWEAGNTATAQLDTVANAFEAEISFSFEIDGLMVKKKIINIHNKRGTTDAATVRLNSEVDNITIKESVANLATCYRVTGGIPDGGENPVTLVGYKYDDGDFYVNASGWLLSRNALSKWSRYQWEQGLSNDVGHIVKNFSSSLTNQKDLFNSALSELKKVCDIQIEYEVDITLLPDNVDIGDTINIIDEKHNLYINARVLKLEIKESEQSHIATLGSYKLKENDISQKIKELSDDFVKMSSSRQLYTWVAYADDKNGTNITLTPDDKAYIGFSYNHTSKQDASSLNDQSIFEWTKIQGNDGHTLYTWVRYADDEKGTNMSADSTNKEYMGLSYNNVIETPSNDPTLYQWSKIEAVDAILLYIDSSNGSSFKNSNVATTLTVTIIVGNKRIENSAEMFALLGNNAKIIWQEKKFGETNYTELLSTDSRIDDNGFIFTVSPKDVDRKCTYNCVLDY